jgi:hypothetical protein
LVLTYYDPANIKPDKRKWLRVNPSGDLEIVNSAYGAVLFTFGDSGAFSATGDITAFSSDKRLKTNIQQIDNALSKVNSIQGITYNHNHVAEEYGFTDQARLAGVLAQDVQRVLPEAVKPAPFDTVIADGTTVSRSGENYLTVQYEKLVPLLIEAIKELGHRVESLETQLAIKDSQ